MKKKALAKYILTIQKSLDETNYANDRSIYSKYLAWLAVMLAKLVNNKNVEEDISQYERLLGHTWIQDEKAAKDIADAWEKFKNQ